MSNQTQQEARAKKLKQLKEDTLKKKRELEAQLEQDQSWKEKIFFWRSWSRRAQGTILILLLFIVLSVGAGMHYRATGGAIDESLENSRNQFIKQLQQSAQAEAERN